MAQTIEGALKISAQKRGISIEEYLEKVKTHKWCNMGSHWQLRPLFNVDKTRHDGLSYKCTECTKSKDPYASLRGRVSTFKGKRHTEENKRLFAENGKLRKPPMAGRQHTLESRLKMSQTRRERDYSGEFCHSYIDGKSVERRGIRFTKEYKRWRYDVYARDNFTCQHCGDNGGGNLNAHHIKPFAKFPELRFEVSNGITLCEPCHEAVHHKPLSTRNIRKMKRQIKGI